MLDIKEIKKDPKGVEAKLRSKESDSDVSIALGHYEKMCAAKHLHEEKLALINAKSKEIGQKKRSGEDTTALITEMSLLKHAISELSEEAKVQEKFYLEALAFLPNLPFDEIKVSPDPEDNICIKTTGEKPSFDFEPKNHVELNETLGYFDFKRGAKLSGSGFPTYRGAGALLEWKLINLMIDTHVKNGFEFWMTPHIVHSDMMYGAGQFPKFTGQAFSLHDNDYPLNLIPTAEVALCGLHNDEIIPEEELPKKYVTYTPCFRREAGASGAGERGLIRTHQFNKVEMFAFTTPEQSEQVFEEMIASAEEVLEKLELHHRNMLLVTGDTSFASAKTIDIECWLPGQNRYYEVSSVSNCTDFQARRSKIRCKSAQGGKNRLVHTLNGSGLATSRLMVALLENNQNSDGSITLPKILS